MSIQAINVRNQFKGKVREIIRGDVVSEVDVETPWGVVTSVITTRAVDDLGLVVGSDVVALVKSTEVSIAKLQRCVGSTMQILVDSAPGMGKKGGVGRSYADAPEIDGVVRLLPPEKISKTLKVGEFTKARIVAAQGHDLVALPI